MREPATSNTTMSKSALLVYSVLLHLYPGAFRRQHGRDMQDAFAMRLNDVHGMFGGSFGIALAFADVVPNAITAHFELLARDTQQALRSIRRAPMLFGGALLILALGVGANVAVFSILQAVLLQPLPYKEPDRVAALWTTLDAPPERDLSADQQKWTTRGLLNANQFLAWREESKTVLSDIAAARLWEGSNAAQFDVTIGDHSERLRGAFVTPNFFEVLGVQASLGRTISSNDDREHASPVVISYGLWQRQFGRDSGIIGRPVTLSTGIWKARAPKSFTIIGVLPRAFRFTYPLETEAWAMLPWADVRSRGGRSIEFHAIARLAPGVPMSVAQARMKQVRAGLYTDTAHVERSEMALLEPIADAIVSDSRAPMMLLSGIALLLFVITCTTVANALFIRVAARKRELAVRSALGADPGRLMRQLVTEGALLALLGTVAGALIAIAAMPLLRRLVPVGFPRADEIAVNKQIVLFAAIVAVCVAMLSAIAPAWRGRRVNLVTMLKRSSGTAFADRSTSRLRTGLIGAQTAIATSLLIVAALLGVSVWNLGHVPLGFDGKHVLTFEMRMLDAKYPDAATKFAFQSVLLERIRNTPGVIEAGVTSAVPFRGMDAVMETWHVGDQVKVHANMRKADSAFFSVMRIGLTRGRLFASGDNLSAPLVAIISEGFAKRIFGSADPIGQVVDDNYRKRTVVGVVRDVRFESRGRDPRPAVYWSTAQAPDEMICVVARTNGDVTAALRKAVSAIDPNLPVMNISTVNQIVLDADATRRFYTTATVIFAALALTLTLAGLMLIVSRMIVERRRELAIRSALGASAASLVQHVMQQGLMPVVIGAAVGVVAAYNLAGFLSKFLFEVTARDPFAYGAIALLVLTAGAIAALVPAARASRARPAEALQAD